MSCRAARSPGRKLLSTAGSLSFSQTASRAGGKLHFPAHGHCHRQCLRPVGAGGIGPCQHARKGFLTQHWVAALRGWRRHPGPLMVARPAFCSMTNPLNPSPLLTPLISSVAMRAIVDDRAQLQRMLDFETALARAEAAVAVIPASCVDRIGNACWADRYDLAALGDAAARAGDVATRRHCRAHRGGGQDRRRGRPLRALGRHPPGPDRQRADAQAARRHRRAASPTSTPPSTASPRSPDATGAPPWWRGPRSSTRCRCRSGSSSRAMPPRLRARASGCAGCARKRWCCNSAAPPGRWRRSARTGLRSPTGSPRCSTCRRRTRPGTPIATALAEIASALAILTGTCGKIARDVALLMQTEVGEAHEPPRSHRWRSGRPAAQAQPQHGSHRHRGRDHRAEPARDHHRRPGAGARARRSAAGRRNGMPCPRCCS